MSISLHKPVFFRVSIEFLRIIWHVRSIFLAQAFLVLAGSVGTAHYEKLPMADALYFAIITGLTVGYGDISPQPTGGAEYRHHGRPGGRSLQRADRCNRIAGHWEEPLRPMNPECLSTLKKETVCENFC
jgi:hypothetical protein